MLHKIHLPVVDGTGSDLPGLVGFRSLNALRAIIDCGRKILYLPGTGEVDIQVPDGTCEIQLQQAPSGHLVMRVDDYENLQTRKGGIPQPCRVFHADAKISAKHSFDL